MTQLIALQPISAASFAPFGQLLVSGPIGEPGPEVIDALTNKRPAARIRLSFAAVPPNALPFEAVVMERHVHSAQAFVPTACAAYLILVAPQNTEGMPDLVRLQAFSVPGDVGIVYKADVWHHPIAALERDGRFAVLTFVDGTAADQEMIRLPTPITITA